MHNFDFWWSILTAVAIGTCVFVFGFLGKINEWYYVRTRFGEKEIKLLPPGDMGWPLIGSTWSFIKAFKSQVPESFLNSLKTRHGETGIYKASLFCNPSIIVCHPELCRKVLTDDAQFKLGYPCLSMILGGKSFDFFLSSGHKQFRRLTTSRINGHEALSTHIGSIEDIVITTLQEWSRRDQPILFTDETNSVAFKVIITIFLGSACDASVMAEMEKHYTCLFNGLFCSAINIPGFAFHKAVKVSLKNPCMKIYNLCKCMISCCLHQARKMLVKIIQGVLAERREKANAGKDIIDFIKEVEDEEGEKLDDEHIIIVLLVFLLAGHESSGRAVSWATMYLHDHPQVLQKAKISVPYFRKNKRRSSEQGPRVKKVIDETLRLRTNIFAIFREAKKDANLNGHFIPKGWKVLVCHSAVHMDPEIYPNPKQFLPSRWDDFKPKAGAFLPFGAGSFTCPAADLAKLEISIFLHYFLLNYKLEQLNPGGPVNYLPSQVPADSCPAKIIKLN
ncbi:hypothetical protein GQ457_08G025520 [Hibiscus cannabinus]